MACSTSAIISIGMALGRAWHNSRPGRWSCLAAIVLLAGAPAGQAMESCAGSYSANRLQPLPKSVIVKLDRHDDSERSNRLADAFMAGVDKAGVAVQGDPSVFLHLNFDISHPPLPRPPENGPLLPDLRPLEGGPQIELPKTNPRRSARPMHPGGAPILSLRTELTNVRTGAVVWTGDFSCALRSSSRDEQIARDMGRVVGGALGRTAARIPF